MQASTLSFRVLLLADAFNSMSQKIFLECKALRHTTNFRVFESGASAKADVATFKPDIILCPFLTKRIPAEIYTNKDIPCLIVHPGIEGDRGMSSIDWALLESQPEWGVTILQADAEMDAGDIWSTKTFPITGVPTKSGLYRMECIDAAVHGVREALSNFAQGIALRPLVEANVKGTLKPKMTNHDRRVEWHLPSHDIVRIVRASDSQPGVLESFFGSKYFMYGCFAETTASTLSQFDAITEPKTILATRDGAILVRCGARGAVWITHLKKANTPSKKYFKLPATSILPEEVVASLPVLAAPSLFIPFGSMPTTFQEVFAWENDVAAFLWFDFYNGAMSTAQCQRLCAAYDAVIATTSSAKTIVLMGGAQFYSNGIHLNVIEAASDPALESWHNINAIDDFVRRILTTSNRVTVSAMQGNSGAGGVMAAIAADIVYAHSNVVLNPSYKAMNLFGSEYWTYSLPKRVGQTVATELTDSTNPISADMALHMGLIDGILSLNATNFVKNVVTAVEKLDADAILAAKEPVDKVQIEECRRVELQHMKACFADPMYHQKRSAFVYKSKLLACVTDK